MITQADGLPDRNVICGIQDKYGFLWLGTRSGLCRYDGSKFLFMTKKSHGLRGTSVLSLVADDSLGIIITYSDMGSSIFPNKIKDVVNIKTMEVKPLGRYYPSLPFDEKDLISLHYRDGQPLRFHTGDTSYRWEYSRASGFQKIKTRRKPLIARLPGIEKRTLSENKEIHDRLNRDFILEADSTLTSLAMAYKTLIRLKKGYLISCDDLMGHPELVTYFVNFKGALLPPDSVEDAERVLLDLDVYSWTANYYYDLNRLNPCSNRDEAIVQLADGSVVHYIPSLGFNKLFDKEDNIHVNSFFKDRQDAFWLCTNVGLYQVTFKRNLFKRHFTRDQKKFAFNNSARGIYADEELMFVSLYDAPVLQIKGDTLLLETYQNFGVIRIDNVLWFGDWYLRKFDIRSRKIELTTKSGKSEVWSIFQLNDTKLLLGCTAGLDIYDIATNTMMPVTCGPFPEPKFVYKIFRNSTGEIMAVAENGLYTLSATGTVTDYFSASAKTKIKKLPCETIYDVFEDNEGTYWIASNLEGLFRWDKVHHTFRQFGIQDGFLSTVMYCIQEDDDDHLWISTDFGLVSLHKKNYAVKTYTELDGITSNEFNRSSAFKDKTGHLYFGGMNGVTSFDPKDFLESAQQNYPFSVLYCYLSDSKTDSLRNETTSLITNKRIVLHEENRSFTLSFSLLDYEDRKHAYAYKLEGLDNDWNYTSENQVRISNPPYGNYTLLIKARLANGAWNENEIHVAVSVMRPFYKTWWFAMLLVFILAGLIYLGVKIWTKRLELRNAKLESMIHERTEELRIAFKEQTALMQEIHHRVKNNLQFIQAMIEMQINASKNESNQLALQETSRRINAMTLVHEMLYNKDKLETISLRDYIHELIDKLSEIVNDNQMTIRFQVSVDDIHFSTNYCLAIGMITSELVSNSIKHAFKKTKEPAIHITLSRGTDPEMISFTVKDNGKCFDKSTMVSGLGMRLIDIFSRQLKGTYSLQNQNGFLFRLKFNAP